MINLYLLLGINSNSVSIMYNVLLLIRITTIMYHNKLYKLYYIYVPMSIIFCFITLFVHVGNRQHFAVYMYV